MTLEFQLGAYPSRDNAIFVSLLFKHPERFKPIDVVEEAGNFTQIFRAGPCEDNVGLMHEMLCMQFYFGRPSEQEVVPGCIVRTTMGLEYIAKPVESWQELWSLPPTLEVFVSPLISPAANSHRVHFDSLLNTSHWWPRPRALAVRLSDCTVRPLRRLQRLDTDKGVELLGEYMLCVKEAWKLEEEK